MQKCVMKRFAMIVVRLGAGYMYEYCGIVYVIKYAHKILH